MAGIPLAPYEPYNFPLPSFQDLPLDALNHIFSQVSFSEFKRLRCVCHRFNGIVKSSQRYLNSQVKFGKHWMQEAKRTTLTDMTKWKHVAFHQFPFCKNAFFSQYWNIAGNAVTQLTLHKLKINCDQLCNFLLACSSLTDLTLEQIHFNDVKVNLIVQQGQPSVQYCVYCSHEIVAELAGPVHITLQKVMLVRQQVVPLCILNLIIQRSRDNLTEFGCRDMFVDNDRINTVPNLTQVCEGIKTILRQSTRILGKLSWCNNSSQASYLNYLMTEVPGLHLREVNLAMPHHLAASTQYFNFLEQIHIRILDNPALNIRFLNLTVRNQFDTARLEQVVGNLVNLDALILVFDNPEVIVDLNFLSDFQRLRQLTVKVLQIGFGQRPRGGVLPTFLKLQNLSRRLNTLSFTLVPKVNTLWLARVASYEMLRTLNIGNCGTRFTDQIMQNIIQTCTELTELKIMDALKLTDYGVTGIPMITAETMISTKSYGLFSETAFMENVAKGVSISDLKDLTCISLSGCRKISDVSLRFGLLSGKIRKVDLSSCLNVTDIGLMWLAKQNPGMERVILKNNRKVSHFGVNQLVKNFKTIVNIHVSKTVIDRRFENFIYEESPNFDDIVTVANYLADKPEEIQ